MSIIAALDWHIAFAVVMVPISNMMQAIVI